MTYRNRLFKAMVNAALFTCMLIAVLVVRPALAETLSPDDFVTVWKTDNSGTSGSTSITIPMVGGPYDVDWNNDGIIDQTGLTGPITHAFSSAGTYTIRIRGTYDSIKFDNGGDRLKLLDITQWGTNAWTTMENAFHGASHLGLTATDTPNFSAVTNMTGMFEGAFAANPDTSNWNTAAVTDMSSMFIFALAANPDTTIWNTAAVTNMREMFNGASAAYPDTSGWNTAAVTDMAGMFEGASAANPDTSGWNTAAVTDMAYMFRYAFAANPDTTNWNTGSVTNMAEMFYFASVANPDTSKWNTAAVTNMYEMFYFASVANPDTTNWNTAAVTNMREMFDGASAAYPDTSKWNTAAVTDMAYMFFGASIANPDTTNWNTAAVTDMAEMFNQASAANPDTTNWKTAAVTNMSGMFYQASAANPDTTNWNTAAVTDMSNMFGGATSFDRDIGGWNVASLTDATDMFKGVTLSTTNYDNLLTGWNNQVLQPSVTFSGGNSKYCSTAAQAARANMIASDSWSITDAGQSCYAVGGAVSGLTGTGLVLQNNGTDDLTVAADGSFTFATKLLDGTNYSVIVSTQPIGQTCSVTNGSGTIAAADVTNVAVACADNIHSVGGNVTGLTGTVVLQNNGTDDLTVADDVVVACADNIHSVGGNVTGLTGTVVLQNNGTDDLTVAADGSFTFATKLPDNTAYLVTVLTQPSGQTCSVTKGSGIVTSHADDVVVDCADTPPPVTSYTGTLPSGATGTLSFTTTDAACTFATEPAFLDTVNPAPPASILLVDGVISFTISNCTPGATVALTMDYGVTLPAGSKFWKSGTPWYQLPATVAGTMVIFSLTDGGMGDADGAANGTIVDPSGAATNASAPATAPIPTMSAWGLGMLAGLLGLIGFVRCRRI